MTSAQGSAEVSRFYPLNFCILAAVVCTYHLSVDKAGSHPVTDSTSPPPRNHDSDMGLGSAQRRCKNGDSIQQYNRPAMGDDADISLDAIRQVLSDSNITDFQSCRSHFFVAGKDDDGSVSRNTNSFLASEHQAIENALKQVEQVANYVSSLVSRHSGSTGSEYAAVEETTDLVDWLAPKITKCRKLMDGMVTVRQLGASTSRTEGEWIRLGGFVQHCNELIVEMCNKALVQAQHACCHLTVCAKSNFSRHSNALLTPVAPASVSDAGCGMCRNLSTAFQRPNTSVCDEILKSHNYLDISNCSIAMTPCLIVSACQLKRAASRHRLLHVMLALRSVQESLSQFHQSIDELFQPAYNFSWNISNEIATTLCHAVMVSRAELRTSDDDILQICPFQCYNTFQLLAALATIQPHVFSGSSQQSRVLALLRQVFSMHCPQPGQVEHSQREASTNIYNTTCDQCMPVIHNPGNASARDATVGRHTHQNCSRPTVHLNISCQHPFIRVSKTGLQSAKMTSLATALTEAACEALHLSECQLSPDLLHCNLVCEPVWYAEAVTSGSLQNWLIVLCVCAVIGWLSSVVALVAFCLNRDRIKSPARRAIVFLNMGIVVYLLDYFLLPFRAASLAVNGACTADNSITVGEPRGANACAFNGFRNIFSSVFIVTVGSCSAHAWYRLAVKLTTDKLLTQDDGQSRLSTVYFMFAVLVSSVMSAIALSLQSMEGAPPYYWCGPDRRTSFYIFTVPYMIMVGAALIAVFVTVPRLKRLQRAQHGLAFAAGPRSRISIASGPGPSRRRGSITSSEALFRLLKLLAVYLLTMTIHAMLVIVSHTTIYINEYMGSKIELDHDGTRTHSMCLMTSTSPQDCARIQQRSMAVEIAFQIYTIFVGFLFSTWAYKWMYWKHVRPFSTIDENRDRKGVLGVLGVIRVLLAPLQPAASTTSNGRESSSGSTDDVLANRPEVIAGERSPPCPIIIASPEETASV
eukprot:scpid18793/ scgid22980/ 